MRILLIEDDLLIGPALLRALKDATYSVDWVRTGESGRAAIRDGSYTAILLDLGLGDMSGLDVLRGLRESNDTTPVIVITARDDVDTRVEGLDLGADDYLVKPFALAELGARVKALSQRPRKRSVARSLQVADLVLDLDTRELARAGRTLRLPPAPMTLLKILMQESPSVVARVRLEEALWLDSPPDSDSLRTHIHQLRQVIDKPFEQALLQTVHGVGYQLRAAQDDAR